MPNVVQINQNFCEWQIRGEIDISAAAAVSASRGDGQTATKTGTGTYVVRVKGAQGLKAAETLYRDSDLVGTIAGTALFCRVVSVGPDVAPNQDDVLITLITSTTKGGAAADNGTAAVTVAYEVVVRSGRITAYP